MRIGVIGAGMIGATLGPLWMRAGHEVRFGTRHPERVQIEGALSQTVADVAAWTEVLMLAVPLSATPDVGTAAGPGLIGKVVLDATNPFAHREPQAAREIEVAGTGSGRWVAQQVPGARVVKAFNTVYFQHLRTATGSGPMAPGVPLAGDDDAALNVAGQLVRDAGFEPVVVGPLNEVTRFEVGTPLWNSGATADSLRAHLGH